MRKCALALLTVVFLVTAPVAAQAVLIDFDTDPFGAPLASGTALTDQYASWGALFEGYENGLARDTVVSTLYDDEIGFDGNYWTNHNADGTDRYDVIRVVFLNPAQNISLYFNSAGYMPVSFYLYDADGGTLEIQNISTMGAWEPLSFSAGNVAYMDIYQPEDWWTYAVDDLSFDSVPIPGAVWLLGSGLMGLIGLRRKFGK